MICRVLLCLLAVGVGFSQSTADVQKEIEALYVKAVNALHKAKTIEDLDEVHRFLDTEDWQSIVPGQPARTWAEFRKFGFDAINIPFDSMTLKIEKFEVMGDTAVLTGRLRFVSKDTAVLVPLTETWRKTANGWKRQIHRKLGPPESAA